MLLWYEPVARDGCQCIEDGRIANPAGADLACHHSRPFV